MATFRFKPQPDITAHELALILAGFQVDSAQLAGQPDALVRHFEAESPKDRLVVAAAGQAAAIAAFNRRDHKPPKDTH